MSSLSRTVSRRRRTLTLSALGGAALLALTGCSAELNQQVRMMQAGATYSVDRIGVFKPKATNVQELGPGEVGFITASIKAVEDALVGDILRTALKDIAA